MVALLFALALLLAPGVGFAAWETTAIPAKDPENLIGGSARAGSCSGASATNASACSAGGGTWTAARSETGVYELRGMVQSAIPVILGISLLWVGWSIARRVVMSFRRS